ncbi:MAG: hypothetical protein LLG06_04570 [Desulfobacteraceae bacterium]|nr:hypothetical protein [Desulfobacteraceae bacterium]
MKFKVEIGTVVYRNASITTPNVFEADPGDVEELLRLAKTGVVCAVDKPAAPVANSVPEREEPAAEAAVDYASMSREELLALAVAKGKTYSSKITTPLLIRCVAKLYAE